MHQFFGFFSLFVFSFVFLMPSNAHAGYLDAGAGSTFVQGIIAVAATISRFWNRCTAPVRGLWKGKAS